MDLIVAFAEKTLSAQVGNFFPKQPYLDPAQEIWSTLSAKIASTGCGELVACSCVVPQLLFPF